MGEIDRYSCVCVQCGYEFEAARSLWMDMGLNSGHGSCPKCRTFLHLEIEGGLDGERMVSELWELYLARECEAMREKAS